VESYVRKEYPQFEAHFVEQPVQNGTAGAVQLARPFIREDLLIIFVDTLFDADLSIIQRLPADVAGVIWVKEVEDYQRFGVVVTDKDGNMTKIVEKPSTPISKRANIGLYYVKNWKLLFEGIDYTLKQPQNKGEYYLTDAFQYMIDHGAKLKVIDVEGWYDAGKLDTLLETNRTVLEKGKARRPANVEKSVTIHDPVYIEDDVTMSNSVIGPNVTIGAGSRIEGSTLTDTIVGKRAKLKGAKLRNSLLGDDVIVEGMQGELTITDHSEIRAGA
jgi:glucose-1-phosphate thymidylyltransferase